MASMGWLGWLRGGSEELGFDDLVKRIAEAIAKLARYAERGRVAFPADVTVRIAGPGVACRAAGLRYDRAGGAPAGHGRSAW